MSPFLKMVVIAIITAIGNATSPFHWQPQILWVTSKTVSHTERTLSLIGEHKNLELAGTHF
jgi:hypothetical protein